MVRELIGNLKERMAVTLLMLLLTAAVGCTTAHLNSSQHSPSESPNGQAVESKKDPAPLVVLDAFGGFVNARFADQWSPRFVLYGDGTVIYRKGAWPDPEFKYAKLTEQELAAALEQIKPSELGQFDAQSFYASAATDLPTNTLLLKREEGKYTRVMVWSMGACYRTPALLMSHLPPPSSRRIVSSRDTKTRRRSGGYRKGLRSGCGAVLSPKSM